MSHNIPRTNHYYGSIWLSLQPGFNLRSDFPLPPLILLSTTSFEQCSLIIYHCSKMCDTSEQLAWYYKLSSGHLALHWTQRVTSFYYISYAILAFYNSVNSLVFIIQILSFPNSVNRYNDGGICRYTNAYLKNFTLFMKSLSKASITFSLTTKKSCSSPVRLNSNKRSLNRDVALFWPQPNITKITLQANVRCQF